MARKQLTAEILCGPGTHVTWTPDAVPSDQREKVVLIRHADYLSLTQRREQNGRYAFDARHDRVCECGHTLGDHSGGSDHDCLRYSLPEATEADKACRCQRFREAKLYLLQNLHAGFLGNSPMFWREGGSGYTQWIDEAQKFTAAQCREVIRGSGGTHKWKRWAWADVDAKAQRTVDMQHFRQPVPRKKAKAS